MAGSLRGCLRCTGKWRLAFAKKWEGCPASRSYWAWLACVLKLATLVLKMRASKSKTEPQLVELLFGAYRRRILSLLLLRPEENFYVREIGRLTGVPAGSLHREVTQLTEAGLLERSTAGNQVRYQANRACPIYE